MAIRTATQRLRGLRPVVAERVIRSYPQFDTVCIEALPGGRIAHTIQDEDGRRMIVERIESEEEFSDEQLPLTVDIEAE